MFFRPDHPKDKSETGKDIMHVIADNHRRRDVAGIVRGPTARSGEMADVDLAFRQ